MEIQIHHNPVYHIVIDNFLPEEQNKEIFQHLISLESKFIPSGIGHKQELNTDYRSNLSLNMDMEYQLSDEFTKEKILTYRANSPLLKMLDNLLSDEKLFSFLDAAPFPLSELRYCDYWSTQVSRYGQKDHYKWHYDYIPNDTSRVITLIYYAHANPKAFTGGELCLTNGLLWGDQLVGETEKAMIEPKNNRLVLFDSRFLHAVLPTHSPNEFDKGRFSVNVWIGKYQDEWDG
ncbi:MAG TPA: 2OG-Fe(II) oxygenase [Cytophagaceae bacterium]|jgi:SM-20-related protein|nr:2OG-Fe(II) oxygenase [Cytophagaceae bacterium]